MVGRTVPDSRESKSVPALVGELWELALAYLKQETVEPAKGLGRFVVAGVTGSVVLGLGLVLLLIGGLRALQDDPDPRVSIADLSVTSAFEREEHRCRALWTIDKAVVGLSPS